MNQTQTQRGFQEQFLYAAKNGYIERAERLLLDGAYDPSADDNAVIIWAAEHGHDQVVRVLLKDPRVDPTANDDFALQVASFNGHHKVVQELLEDGRSNPGNMNSIALWGAAQNGHFKVVEILVEDGRVDLNAKSDEMTALEVAVLNGYDDIGALLLQAAKSTKSGKSPSSVLPTPTVTTPTEHPGTKFPEQSTHIPVKSSNGLPTSSGISHGPDRTSNGISQATDPTTNGILPTKIPSANVQEHNHLPLNGRVESRSEDTTQVTEITKSQSPSITQQLPFINGKVDIEKSRKDTRNSSSVQPSPLTSPAHSKTPTPVLQSPHRDLKSSTMKKSLGNLRRISIAQSSPPKLVAVTTTSINEKLFQTINTRKTIPFSDFSSKLVQLRSQIDTEHVEITSEVFNQALQSLLKSTKSQRQSNGNKKHNKRGTLYLYTKEVLYFGNGLSGVKVDQSTIGMYRKACGRLKLLWKSLRGERGNPLEILTSFTPQS